MGIFRRRAERKEVMAFRKAGRTEQSDEHIEAELMATLLEFQRRYGGELGGFVKHAMPLACSNARAALECGVAWDDALAFGRIMLMGSVISGNPGVISEEDREEFADARQQWTEKHGRPLVDRILDRADGR